MVKAEPDTESGEVQISTVFNLGGQRVGYVIGTEGEIALSNWIAETQVQIQPQPYLTYDEMLSALFGNEVVAIAGRDTRLLRTAAPVLEAVELLNTPLQEEPFTIAIPRQDTHFRNLLNRTLQYLASDAEVGQQSSLEVLHSEYFPNDDFPFNALPVYANVGDEAPALAAFPTDVPIPSVYAAPNILANGVLRVVGNASTEGLLPSQAFVPTANQNLVREIASRWGVEVQFVAGDPLQAVRDGTADIAVGIEPTWDVPGVDFSQPYAQHGRRLLYPSDRDYAQLSSLMATSRVVATLDTEDDAEELVEAWGNRVGIFNFRFFTTSWDTAAENLLENNNALVLIGDSLSLLPIVQQNPDTLSIGPTWYDRQYLTFALPQNDVDFR
ncbi:MAG: transporter substrate-binding domain-containing protein, partial [Chloroflexota bacterium]